MKKRLFAAMLCLCMMIALLPAAALAAGTGAMAAGMDGITDGSIVYFGQYTEGGQTYEVPWLVLDADKTNVNTGGAFLISKYLLGSTPFEAAWDSDDGDGQASPDAWQNSDAQAWCKSYATSPNFAAAELSAMVSTIKTDRQYLEYGASTLEKEKVFFLSGEEAAGYFNSDAAREAVFISNPTGNTGWWWLRSPYGDKPYNAGVVSVVQRFTRVSYADGARPAFNLDLSRVLLTSAAQRGKVSGPVGAGALKAVPASTPVEWKLTLLDSSRNFQAERTAYDSIGKMMTLGYSGAAVGANEYISAVIMDGNGAVKYYGNIAKPQRASGSAKLDLSGITLGAGDKLYVFSETANGDKKTDYASALKEISTGASGSNNGNDNGNDNNGGNNNPGSAGGTEEGGSGESEGGTTWTNPFTDVKTNDWFYEAVKYVREKGLMSGTSAETFSPHTATTRGMLVTILYKLEGTPEISGNPFNDVAAGAYYANATAWAQQNGIASGYGNGRFGPNDAITREQLATILMNYARFKGYDVTVQADLTQFKDRGAISGYAAGPMTWATAEGLISGKGNGILDPRGSAERCQAASILMKFMENIAK